MKLFIIGPGRHGKDTAGDFFKEHYGLKAVPSSLFMAERVCWPYMENLGFHYATLEECFNDRHTGNNRCRWRDAIAEFNGPDPARLSSEIFAENDIYVGIRARREFLAAKPLSDLSIWVDASERVPEIDPSLDILKSDADIVIDNNGTVPEFLEKLRRFAEFSFDLVGS